MAEECPEIVFTLYTPYLVANVKKLTNSKGEPLEVQHAMSLCRCGASKYKPFCDGSHSSIGFVGKKEDDRWADDVKEYVGREVTILDNRGVCSADGACTAGSPGVFNVDKRPWIDPNGDNASNLIATIERCPSGALAYRVDGELHDSLDREPEIKIAKDGPLEVVGRILLVDDMNSTPQCEEHYTLCRCGGSSNKPFCDGTHVDIGFKDDDN